MRQNEKAVPPFSLGWELEATRRATGHYEGLEAGHDGSVNGDGIEYRLQKGIVHKPLAGIRALRQLVSDRSLAVDSSCGFHVHIGLGRRTRHAPVWAASFVALARAVEETAFAVVPSSRRSNQYCREWRTNRGSVIDTSYSRDKGRNGSRYHWLNVVEMFRPGGIRTVEVRLMGDTKRYIYLLGWVALCRLMAASAWRISFDPSALPEEAAKIKRAMMRLADALAYSPRETIHYVLGLTSETGLSEKRDRPLSALRAIEDSLRFTSLARELERSVASRFAIGDIVECVEVDPEQNTTVGHRYEIAHNRPERAGAYDVLLRRGDDGMTWWVPANCVRLVRHARMPSDGVII